MKKKQQINKQHEWILEKKWDSNQQPPAFYANALPLALFGTLWITIKNVIDEQVNVYSFVTNL